MTTLCNKMHETLCLPHVWNSGKRKSPKVKHKFSTAVCSSHLVFIGPAYDTHFFTAGSVLLINEKDEKKRALHI